MKLIIIRRRDQERRSSRPEQVVVSKVLMCFLAFPGSVRCVERLRQQMRLAVQCRTNTLRQRSIAASLVRSCRGRMLNNAEIVDSDP